MFKNYLQGIEGIEIFPVIGLILFFIMFVLIIVWVLKIDKKYLQRMKELPLDSELNKVSGNAVDFKNLTGDKNEN